LSKLPVCSSDDFQELSGIAKHRFSIANQPGDRLLDSADLVITIGYDPVEYPPSDWNRNNGRKIIHIDVLPAALDNAYRPYAELTGDIASTLNLLTPEVKRLHRSDLVAMILKAIATERAELTRESADRNGTPIHPLRLVAELQPFLSSDVTMTLDMGSFHLWLARYLYSFRARQILISNGQQTLGVALPGRSRPQSCDRLRKPSRYLVTADFSFPRWS
jgi:acetolactate synthase I/II/III large subunit